MAQDDEQDGGETVYKTKVVQFLGRSVPIVLQCENGPCPLLSICNVLLLRNSITINPDMREIPLKDLLSLVAGRLLDANFDNLENKDEEYVRNQQQNIADAISLLPRLATGLDVNVQFRNTQDFEFTPECAIFDLLDIGLYHGWICEDENTKEVIGAHSFNALQDRLAVLQANRSESRTLKRESSVDFNAAITATFTVPSPSLSSVAASLSDYDEQLLDSNILVGNGGKIRKGDEQEVAQLLEALELSKSGSATPESDALAAGDSGDYSAEEVLSDGSPLREESGWAHGTPVVSSGPLNISSPLSELISQSDPMALKSLSEGGIHPMLPHIAPDSQQEMIDAEFRGGNDLKRQESMICSGKTAQSSSGLECEDSRQPIFVEDGLKDAVDTKDWILLSRACTDANAAIHTTGEIDGLSIGSHDVLFAEDTHGKLEHLLGVRDNLGETAPFHQEEAFLNRDQARLSGTEREATSVAHAEGMMEDIGRATGKGVTVEEGESVQRISSAVNMVCDTEGIDYQETLYEGEVPQIGSGRSHMDSPEPLYEGEATLAEQSTLLNAGPESIGKNRSGDEDASEGDSPGSMTEEQILGNFLINSSQLTWTGLFSLQDQVKERELCVFFRNNHFSTMFKYNKELYLLATDQGYLHQTDLVWEKLEQVDGNHSFVTGNFTPFHAESNTGSWNEQDVIARTENYISNQRDPGGAGADYNSDLQLALALQQQEFEEQQQPPPQQSQQQGRIPTEASPSPTTTPGQVSRTPVGGSRLVTGPRTSSASKPEPKKEKCVIM